MRNPNYPLHLSLKHEDGRIYFLVNLIKYGYWTKDDFAQMREFGERFWSCDFTELILPKLRPLDPECSSCGRRDVDLVSNPLLCSGEPLCFECTVKIREEIAAREIGKGVE